MKTLYSRAFENKDTKLNKFLGMFTSILSACSLSTAIATYIETCQKKFENRTVDPFG
jgi:hypothetical protein